MAKKFDEITKATKAYLDKDPAYQRWISWMSGISSDSLRIAPNEKSIQDALDKQRNDLMPYIEKAITNPRYYWCSKCSQWYRRGNLRCLVNHPEGQCCHQGDKAVTCEDVSAAVAERRNG